MQCQAEPVGGNEPSTEPGLGSGRVPGRFQLQLSIEHEQCQLVCRSCAGCDKLGTATREQERHGQICEIKKKKK